MVVLGYHHGMHSSASKPRRSRPRLSVIICTYNMPREAPRTLLSAGIPYQQDIGADDYEVIVVDNGSSKKLTVADRERLPPGVTLVDMPEPQPSPVFAMNWAARHVARGDILLFAIDGARIFSKRLYAATLAAHAMVEDAFVYTLGWHLGPKVQMKSTREGYDQAVEDRLIAESGWPAQADALYDISVFSGSSAPGFFAPISESNAFSMRRDLFERMGGYDPRYTSPGGGLCNLEIFGRYVTRPGGRNICLLSEGSFHQVHGGIATSGVDNWEVFNAEHKNIFGSGFSAPTYDTLYYGQVRAAARRFVRQSVGD